MVVGGMAMLEEVARAGDINGLYALLRQCQKLLEEIDKEPFIDTPLHVAASFGCTHFALEIMRLKPSFGKKLNPDGLSPLHLALHNGHTSIVKGLIRCDPELVGVQGKEGITPLHCVAESDDHVDLLAEFLVTCPASIKVLTIRGETAVHVAVKNGKQEAFEVLNGWLYRTNNTRVLKWKDENGDTPLHLAVSTNQPKILKLLIGQVEKNEKNLEGKTALDIAMGFPEEENKNVMKILKHHKVAEGSSVDSFENMASFLSSHPKKIREFVMGFDVYLDKGLSGDMRNALLVVVVLIATATYQAILEPPSFWQSDNPPSVILNGTYITHATAIKNATITSIDQWSQAGKPKFSFYYFLFVNSIAFGASLGMIFGLLPRNRYILSLYVSLFCMLISYLIIGYLVSPDSMLPSVSLLIACLLFAAIAEIRILLSGNKFWQPKVKHLHKMRRTVISGKYPEQTDI